MRNGCKKALAVILSVVMATGAFAGDFNWRSQSVEAASSGNPIRVDINKNENRPLAYSETFTNWNVPVGNGISTTVDGVTFTLSNGGTTGNGIKGALDKALLRDGDTTSPRLTADGVLVNFDDGEEETGGIIKLEISGLSAGTHTLKTWHSFFNKVEGSSMTLSIDGQDVANIAPVSRVNTDDEAMITYVEFEAKESQTVTVVVRPNGDGTFNNAVLNAFAIDDVEAGCLISNPYPADGEGHFHPEEGLSWTGGKEAISHDVYFGTDYDAVKNATKESPEYKGNQVATSYAVEAMNLSHMETYYWRIDEVTEKGTFQGDVQSFGIAHLAFPTAEGYGRFAKGGRGGRIIEVTNLNDSGPGSLRQALEVEKGPRIVVFRVGGVIKLEDRLVIPSDGGNVYVAGQTAPGDGITLTHQAFGIYYAEDVIIRHVRLRVGDTNGESTDGMGMAGANHSIIDHCSIAWTTDEGHSSRGAKNITFQHNIIAEALNNSVHYNANDRNETEDHSFAGSISGNVGSYHHNLLVNCAGRNWSMAGGMEQDGVTYAGKLDIRNNVVYNYSGRTTDGGVQRVNFVNNYYKMGEESENMKIFTIDGNELSTNDMQMAYVSGNMLVEQDGDVLLSADQDAWEVGRASALKNATNADVRSDVPFYPSYVETETAEEAYESVLADVGANVPKLDYLDTRYIKETKTGTYTYIGSKDGYKGIIDSQDDVGGYPQLQGGTPVTDDDHDGMADDWETLHGLNPADAADGNGLNLSPDGYTNVEMYLNELAGDDVRYYGEDGTEPTPSTEPSNEPEPSVIPSAEPTPTPDSSKVPFSGKLYIASDSLADGLDFEGYEGDVVGWGDVISKEYTSDVTVINEAKYGDSTKSYYYDYDNDGDGDGHRYKAVYDNIAKDDYVIICFGHNDGPANRSDVPVGTDTETQKASDTQGTYQWYLKYKYIEPALDAGALPILMTPVVRCMYNKTTGAFEEKEYHLEYAQAMRDLVAEYAANGITIPLIDAQQYTYDTYSTLSESQAAEYHATNDVTHYNQAGAEWISEYIAGALCKYNLGINDYLVNASAAPEPSEVPTPSPEASIEPSTSPEPSEITAPSPEPSETVSPSPGTEPSDIPSSEEPKVMLGDVDKNGKVELPDAQMALKAALKIMVLEEDETERADVDQNLEINLTDAQLILKYALKIISKFDD